MLFLLPLIPVFLGLAAKGAEVIADSIDLPRRQAAWQKSGEPKFLTTIELDVAVTRSGLVKIDGEIGSNLNLVAAIKEAEGLKVINKAKRCPKCHKLELASLIDSGKCLHCE